MLTVERSTAGGTIITPEEEASLTSFYNEEFYKLI